MILAFHDFDQHVVDRSLVSAYWKKVFSEIGDIAEERKKKKK